MITTTAKTPPITGSIVFKQFIITLQLEKPEAVSQFPTATIRGGFGITLRKLVCPTIDLQCQNCILRHNCVYAFLFETIPPPDAPRMKHYKAVPHPFTLWCIQSADILTVHLTLIGKAIPHLPYFIYTLRKLGTQGLGWHKNRYTVENVTAGSAMIFVKDCDDIRMDFQNDTVTFSQENDRSGSCSLEFYSPIVLRKDGATVDGYDHYAFFSTLLRRLTSLFSIHCDGANFNDCKPLLEQWIQEIKAEPHLTRTGASRFSTRQQQQIDYDGFTGTIQLTGNVGPFMSFLKAGEILAVGKNTAFGFGRYRVGDIKWNQ